MRKEKKKGVEYFGREPVKARCARGEMFDTITKIFCLQKLLTGGDHKHFYKRKKRLHDKGHKKKNLSYFNYS